MLFSEISFSKNTRKEEYQYIKEHHCKTLSTRSASCFYLKIHPLILYNQWENCNGNQIKKVVLKKTGSNK